MAPPFRWFDAFCDAGWPAVLSPAALRVILAVGRRVNRHTRQTQMRLERLQREANLPARSFWRAKTELTDCGLLRRSQEERRWTLTLTFPVPTVPSAAENTAIPGSRDCQPWQETLPAVAHADRRDPHHERKNATVRQETKAQLEEQTEKPGRAAVLDYLSRQGLSGESLSAFLAAVGVLRSERGTATRDAEVSRLGRLMQSQGRMDWFEDRVREVLVDAVAIAHPLTQAAFEMFDGHRR